jgi:hypothetical protein
MRWNIDWNQDWDDWLDTFGSWWRQVRPAGLMKSDLSDETDWVLSTLTRDSQGQPRESISHQQIREAGEAYAAIFPDHRGSGLMRWTVNSTVAEGLMRSQLDLRLTRLQVACERFRKTKGDLPREVADLVPDFLKEPLVCPLSERPLTLEPQPGGRILLRAGGTDPEEPVELTFPTREAP